MIPTVSTIQRGNEILRQIEGLQIELAGLFGGNGAPVAKPRGRPPGSGKASSARNGGPLKRTRRMSAAGRARIAAATKARWAKFHAEQDSHAKPSAASKPAAKPGRKRGMSAGGRAAIAAAQKARWAKIREEKKKAGKA